ncbi:MAG: XdhC family protein [Gordonia sp. (in: high G+C Gram-positive bacteria)]|uniref:XdhC family protein n=1 Tax=Gordonia sp. (in: high G+C Gram-positive bacteria) TaxID=84139 RepID=UPI0039E2FAAF
MRERLAELEHWWTSGRPAALATVVATSASAPLPVGSVMAVGPRGEVIGSVSGGCVEAAVYAECVDAMSTGRPALMHYGFSDDDALAAGLTCGGTLDVLVTRFDGERFPGFGELVGLIAADVPVAVVTVLDGEPDAAGAEIGARMVVAEDSSRESRSRGSTGSAEVDAAIFTALPALLAAGESGVHTLPAGRGCAAGTVRVFTQVFVPRRRLIVFGATDFAVALTAAGAFLGYRVTLCNARPVFAAPDRFPAADEVVRRWPHEYFADELAAGRINARTAVCVLTHDERFDRPLLTLALESGAAGYLGAMGSRRTHERRLADLREDGVSEEALVRLHSPIGLDLQARTPQETAVSIVAEILADRGGGTGRPLAAVPGAIHSAGGRSTSTPEARSPHSTARTVVEAR